MKYYTFILLAFFFVVVASCKKKDVPSEVSIVEISNITSISAICQGNVELDGNTQITEKGVCWGRSTDPLPTIQDSKIAASSGGKGLFSVTLSGLELGTTYNVRAYATNKKGTTYGDLKTITTSSDPNLLPISIKIKSVRSTTEHVLLKGNLSVDPGINMVIEKGFCWGTTISPTISNSTVIQFDGSSGDFSSELTNTNSLVGTKYYVSTYFKTSYGAIVYGYYTSFEFEPIPAPINFNTALNYGSVIDNEGNVYKTVVIGTQTWMAENLKVTHYNNGDPIPLKTDLDQPSQVNDKYQWPYLLDENFSDAYGRNYTWYTIMDTRGVCPTNWHLPTEYEWITLINNVGLENLLATTHWSNNTIITDNSSGFTAMPGGQFGYFGIRYSANWWTMSSTDNENAKNILLEGNGSITYYNNEKSSGFSVRCILD